MFVYYFFQLDFKCMPQITVIELGKKTNPPRRNAMRCDWKHHKHQVNVDFVLRCLFSNFCFRTNNEKHKLLFMVCFRSEGAEYRNERCPWSWNLDSMVNRHCWMVFLSPRRQPATCDCDANVNGLWGPLISLMWANFPSSTVPWEPRVPFHCPLLIEERWVGVFLPRWAGGETQQPGNHGLNDR